MKCGIVRDLLPNYLDHLTCEESNFEIENHLQTCEACKEYFDEMSGADPVLASPDLDAAEEKKEIDVLKSFRKHRRRGIGFICIAAVIVLALIYIVGFFEVAIPYEKAQPEVLVSDTSMTIEFREEYGTDDRYQFKGIHVCMPAGNTTYNYTRIEIYPVTIDGEEQLIGFVTSYDKFLEYMANRNTFSLTETGGFNSVYKYYEGELEDGTPVSEVSAVYYLDAGFKRAENADDESLLKILEKHGHMVWSQELGNRQIYHKIIEE